MDSMDPWLIHDALVSQSSHKVMIDEDEAKVFQDAGRQGRDWNLDEVNAWNKPSGPSKSTLGL